LSGGKGRNLPEGDNKKRGRKKVEVPGLHTSREVKEEKVS